MTGRLCSDAYRRPPLPVALLSLLALSVSCQAGTTTARILVPLENVTVALGDTARFFCQIQGNYGDLRLRVNGSVKAFNFQTPNLSVTAENGTSDDDMPYTNISISITATKKRNNTELECYDTNFGREGASNATLIVKGGLGKPEVTYNVLGDKEEIVFSWQRPFTWEEYPITGYEIKCRDKHPISNYIINDTDTANRSFVNHTVKLPDYIPDCYSLQCNVTASNDLDSSKTSTTNIYFPKMLASPVPVIELVKTISLKSGKQGVIVCVKLPVLCEFQRVEYSVVFSSGGGSVLELYREFNYSSGYTSECIEVEKVDQQLEEGVQYSVQVFVNAGESGNSSSPIHTFKHQPIPGTVPSVQHNGLEGSGDDSDETAKTGHIVDIAMGTVMIIIIVILIIFAFIIIGMWRATRGNRSAVRSTRPPGATNQVFDHQTFPPDREDGGKTKSVEEPYYYTLDGGGSEQKAHRPPNEPFYTTPFSGVNNKKK